MVEEKGLAEVKSKVCVVHIEVRCVCQIEHIAYRMRQISTTCQYAQRGRSVLRPQSSHMRIIAMYGFTA